MTLRVLAIPAAHPYVQAVSRDVQLLDDPIVPGAAPGAWWPHQALDAEWIKRHAERFDVVHVHFGTEGRSSDDLSAFVDAVREAGRPLVFTAHDLEHPHLADPTGHAEHLALLTRGANAVLTLTPGAADVLRASFGVPVKVVPHPQIAAAAWFARSDERRRNTTGPRPRVGVHLRALRANIGTGDWLRPLADAVSLAGGRLEVFFNDETMSRDGSARGEALRRSLVGLDADVVVRPRPDDEALAAELASLDVSVLPYAHGTHSGWLELCWDLGTRVLAPRVGFFAQQRSDAWFLESFDQADPGAAATGLGRLLSRPSAPAGAERLAQRTVELDHVVAKHTALYRRLVAGRSDEPRPIISA